MQINNTLKKGLKIVLWLLFAIIFVLLIVASPYLWKHWLTYPKLEKERAAIWASYKKPQQYIKLKEYKGAFHVHSYWSHDSRGTLNEILSAAKKADYDFLFFADHPHGQLDTFPRSYSGTFDNVIFEPGTESSHGLMVTPMDSVVLDWGKGDSAVIHQVVENNGLVLYVHTEKEHDWDNPDYQAMEIYNIHTDFLDGNDGILSLVMNLLINKSKYHHWVFREIYDEQTNILANWDAINGKHKIVGMAGVDAHNNQSFRAKKRTDGKVEWVGPNAKTIDVVEPGLKEKILLGVPNKDGWAFKWEFDPYFLSFNHVANNIFSDTLSNFGIKNNLVAGHAFISFQSLAKADGFQYFSLAKNNQPNAIMGDSIPADSVAMLKAVSPFPVKFQLIKNGELIDQADNVYSYEYQPKGNKGNYRIVAKLFLNKKWVSWVFTNPMYLY